MSRSDPSRPAPQLPPRRSAPTFQPRFMIGMIYLIAFFFLYSFMLVLPELLDVFETMPVGPAQEEKAFEVVRANSRPYWTFFAAVVTVVGGAHYQVLPGLR